MKKIANLSIGARLGLSFAMVLGLMAVMAGVSIYQLRQIAAVNEQMQDKADRFAAVEKWQGAVTLNLNRALTVGRSGYHPATVAFVEPQMKATSDTISQLQAALDKDIHDADERRLFDAVGVQRKAYVAARAQAIDAFKAGNAEAGEKLVVGPMTASADAYLAAIDTLQKHDQAGAEALAQEVRRRDAQAQVLLALVSALAVAISAWMAWAMTRSVTRPLRYVIEAAERIAAHDLTTPLRDTGRRDEIGKLQRSLRSMQHNLTDMVRNIRAGTNSVATASNEIASAGTDLSNRTEQTSSALQQTASAMEEITATVGQTADSARTANQLATSASDVAQRGGAVVSQVVATMDEINASSKRIADIIGTIDGIAFQTNILALNAAVEAARAGEQGRGFAVVASEVRSLAGRSAEAAREIKALIGNSVDRVETGARLVTEAGSTMGEIVQSVKRVTDIIGEVQAASDEQTRGIGQVNGSVAQLDQMTQQNAALVEETAAAASALREQASHLADLVANFKLDDDSTQAAHQAQQVIARAKQPVPAPAPVAQRSPLPARKPATTAAAASPAAPTARATSASQPRSTPTKTAVNPAPASSTALASDSDWETF